MKDKNKQRYLILSGEGELGRWRALPLMSEGEQLQELGISI